MRGRSTTFTDGSINARFTLVLIILVTLFSWIITIFFKERDVLIGSNNYFFQLIRQLKDYKDVLFIANIVLFLGTTFLMLLLNRNFSIIRNKTLLPLLFYSLFLTTNTDVFFSFTGNVVTLIILFCFFQLFDCYQKAKTVEEAFNIGLLLALASFFSIQALYLLPIFWIGFFVFKADSFKTFFASLIGIFTPYWFVFCWFVYKNDLQGFIDPFLHLFQFNPEVILEFDVVNWIQVGITIVITFFAVINFQFQNFKDKIRSRIIFYFLFTTWVILTVMQVLGIIPMSEYHGIQYFITALFAAHFFSIINNRLNTIFFYLILFTYIGLLFFDL